MYKIDSRLEYMVIDLKGHVAYMAYRPMFRGKLSCRPRLCYFCC